MFVFWNEDQLKSAIVRMEEQMALGASQVASPTEGSMTLLSPTNARLMLERLYRAYERKTGAPLNRERSRTQIKTFQVTVDPQENIR